MMVSKSLVVLIVIAGAVGAIVWALMKKSPPKSETGANAAAAAIQVPLDASKVIARYVRLEPITVAWIHIDAMMAYNGEIYLRPVDGYPRREDSFLGAHPWENLLEKSSVTYANDATGKPPRDIMVHTKTDQEYVELDLGADVNIDRVFIKNRWDMQGRLVGCRLVLQNAARATVWTMTFELRTGRACYDVPVRLENSGSTDTAIATTSTNFDC